MDISKKIKILDAAYFLMDKYNYKRVNIISVNNDMWLYNQNESKFPLIRLTGDTLLEGRQNKDSIIAQANQMSQLLNINPSLLNIHFDKNDEDVFFEPNYYQALVSEDVISPILNEEFKNFNKAFKPISDNLENDLKRRELKIIDLANKPKTKQKISIKSLQVTHILVLLNVLMYIVGLYITYNYTNLFSMIFQGAIYKNLIYGASEYWRLITAGFVHADSFHILINMFALFQTGILVERIYGKKQMLFIYFSGLITSSLLALINSSGKLLTVGASGAIFGLIGAILVYLFTSDLYKVKAIRNQIISTLFTNLLISLLPGVSFYGHLGGLIGGFLAALAISNSPKLKSTKIHAYISLVFVVVLMSVYALFYDNNVYDVDSNIDKHIVSSYYQMGIKNYAIKLDNDIKVYYKTIGEDY